jgi:hypothetical protein
VPLLIERKSGERQLLVKQVKLELDDKRYIVCRDEARPKKTATTARRLSRRSMPN